MLRRTLILMIVLYISAMSFADDSNGSSSFWSQFAEPEIHGFVEGRGGFRTRNDPDEKDSSIMETRLQVDVFTYNDWADFKFKGDVWYDGILGDTVFDTRELWMFTRPTDYMDIKIGRQILTWGTGDLLFLNDMFPKDWQSFFIGRDTEYLKAPSNAVKFSFFHDLANVDVVYTPQFDSDRHITGDYISYWDGNLARRSGRDKLVRTDKPNTWFKDDEIAMRIYKNINNYEYALYGYWGYWKSPGGQNASGIATFPRLNVYGASLRGQLGSGIVNAEIAYYQSTNDINGSNFLINNSEMRYLVGYTQELAKDFNAGIQYYIEQMLNYDNYTDALPAGSTQRDEFRHLLTLRLTQLMMNQNLRLSLFTYYSPTDRDTYMRPNINYKVTDDMAVEVGANLFYGKQPHTFFGQFENNSNIYTSVRYNF